LAKDYVHDLDLITFQQLGESELDQTQYSTYRSNKTMTFFFGRSI